MRKFSFLRIFLCLLICLACAPTKTYALADSDYRRVIDRETPFYSDATGTEVLFYLPYTYYVKVLEYGQNLTHVECFGTGKSIALDGYVPTDMLFNDGLSVINPYLEQQIVTQNTTVLYADNKLLNPLQYVFSSRELVYYGQSIAPDGKILFYVGYNNRLGYVTEDDIIPFEETIHPNELTFLIPEPEPEQPNMQNSDDNGLITVRTVIIICLFFAGVIALLIALKKKPKSHETSFYDDNEYE